MTLLLTCVTSRYAVQASDRRLTLLGGGVAEDVANKATMLCRHATFAYTGLAQCSAVERTDDLLHRCLASPLTLDGLLHGLAKEATSAIRGLALPLPPTQRRIVRRTSFVGTGFVELINPGEFGRQQSADRLHPFLAVVSNAQGLSEEWRAAADRDFVVNFGYLDEETPFLLHAAGQPFRGVQRRMLDRAIRRSLGRTTHPEPLARLLARAVRAVAAENSFVGPNVMCTIVRRENVRSRKDTFISGLIPFESEIQTEAMYFRRRGGDNDAQWIYSPGEPIAARHYAPNYACGTFRVSGFQIGFDFGQYEWSARVAR